MLTRSPAADGDRTPSVGDTQRVGNALLLAQIVEEDGNESGSAPLTVLNDEQRRYRLRDPAATRARPTRLTRPAQPDRSLLMRSRAGTNAAGPDGTPSTPTLSAPNIRCAPLPQPPPVRTARVLPSLAEPDGTRWVKVAYESAYDPSMPYHLELQWLSSPGHLVADFVAGLQRRVARQRLLVVAPLPVYRQWDPFAAPTLIDMPSLRMYEASVVLAVQREVLAAHDFLPVRVSGQGLGDAPPIGGSYMHESGGFMVELLPCGFLWRSNSARGMRAPTVDDEPAHQRRLAAVCANASYLSSLVDMLRVEGGDMDVQQAEGGASSGLTDDDFTLIDGGRLATPPPPAVSPSAVVEPTEYRETAEEAMECTLDPETLVMYYLEARKASFHYYYG
jgi:hypothetical protein